MSTPHKKIMTIFCVYNREQILLGKIKKDGVLKDKYNGFGGKVEPNEDIAAAAKRELWEEARIVPLNFKKRGIIVSEFVAKGNPWEGNPVVEFHIFSTTKYTGVPIETNEMLPTWFKHSEIPYDNIWPDDKFWLPLLLAGKNFVGNLKLKNTNEILEFKLEEVENLC